MEQIESKLSAYDGAQPLKVLEQEWSQYKSGTHFYDASFDIFDEYAEEKLIELTEDVSNRPIVSLSVPIFAMLIILTSIIVAFFTNAGLDSLWNSGVRDRFAQVLGLFGLSKAWFGNNYVLSVLLFALLALLERIRFHFKIFEQVRKIKKITERFKQKLFSSKQVYPGSGQISFSFGDEGMLIKGGYLDFSFRWSALEDIEFVLRKDKLNTVESLNFEIYDSSEEQGEGSPPELGNAFDEATHIIVWLKEPHDINDYWERFMNDEEVGPFAEFFVIPRSFFKNPRDHSNWFEFCSELSVRLKAN